MRLFVCATLAVLTLTNPSFAQVSPSDLSVSDLANACIVALDEGSDAEVYAVELAQRERFNLGSENRAKGELCLETVFETDFVFEAGSYISYELIAADEQRLLELEIEAAERELLYNLAVTETGMMEYQIDRFRALTTPICGLVFKTVGLP
jgi:hypothetical protein